VEQSQLVGNGNVASCMSETDGGRHVERTLGAVECADPAAPVRGTGQDLSKKVEHEVVHENGVPRLREVSAAFDGDEVTLELRGQTGTPGVGHNLVPVAVKVQGRAPYGPTELIDAPTQQRGDADARVDGVGQDLGGRLEPQATQSSRGLVEWGSGKHSEKKNSRNRG
jgi:hypothetical protein